MVFGWLSALEVLGLVLVLLGLCLVGLAVRRRWLARHGGTFECSMSRHVVRVPVGHPIDIKPTRDNQTSDESTPSPRWVLGVARYSGENFEWFRFFSLAWWPKYTFLRSQVSVLDHAAPAPSEAVALYADQEVVTVAIGSGDAAERRQLAMTPESLTGMMSWLEAAPPGIGGY